MLQYSRMISPHHDMPQMQKAEAIGVRNACAFLTPIASAFLPSVSTHADEDTSLS